MMGIKDGLGRSVLYFVYHAWRQFRECGIYLLLIGLLELAHKTSGPPVMSSILPSLNMLVTKSSSTLTPGVEEQF